MKTFEYKLREENAASQRAGGRYHAAAVLLWSYQRHKYRAIIGAGSSDEVAAFRSGDEIIVVSRNCGMGYVGAESFPLFSQDKPDDTISTTRVTHVPSNSVFFQNADEELSEHCPKWEDCTLRHVARVLQEWLQ